LYKPNRFNRWTWQSQTTYFWSKPNLRCGADHCSNIIQFPYLQPANKPYYSSDYPPIL